MPERESTTRTRELLSQWSGKESRFITLDTRLNVLRVNHRQELRQMLDEEFAAEGSFPIDDDEWDEGKLEKFRNVRDLVEKKLK